MKRNQKGLSSIFIIVVVVLLAVAGFYLLSGKTATFPIASPNQDIQSDSGLTNASSDLDNINIDTIINPQLNQNDADAQTFGNN